MSAALKVHLGCAAPLETCAPPKGREPPKAQRQEADALAVRFGELFR
jgi:hypothetical protein